MQPIRAWTLVKRRATSTRKRNLARRASVSSPEAELQTHRHGKQRLRCCRRRRPGGKSRAFLLVKALWFSSSHLAGRPRPHRPPRRPRVPQLQYVPFPSPSDASKLNKCSLRTDALARREDPARLGLLPPRPGNRLRRQRQPQTPAVDALLLRASLRCRHH